MKLHATVALTLLASCACAAMPRTATIIPAPREMTVTGGEYWAKKPPKYEKVASIPPEGYELSITKDGMTIRTPLERTTRA